MIDMIETRSDRVPTMILRTYDIEHIRASANIWNKAKRRFLDGIAG